MSVQSSNQSEAGEVIKQSDPMPFTIASGARGPELSVIVPTFNERDNVEPLLMRLEAALCGIEWEVIYVDDDSPDGTADKIRSLAQANPRIRCIQRIGRRGLSTAVIEGMLSSSARYLAVIDADLQHDEMVLPRMLDAIKAHDVDIVVGSRYAAGGGVGEWDRRRVTISGTAARLARLVVPAELSDPMSGFFLISRSAFERAARRLSGQGFKILVDLFASTLVPYRFTEIPYVFRQRLHGNSKLDCLVAWEYLMLLLDKRLGGFVPLRFVSFATIGVSGVAVHFITLYCTLQLLTFPIAQALGTIAAMTSNFVLNNVLTYRDRRLSGRRFFTGLASFYGICSIGAVANVGIASAAFGHHYTWWFSGLAGAAVGAVWNYAVSSTFTWGRR